MEFCDIRRTQRVLTIAIDALKLPTADVFAQQKSHRLPTLGADGRLGVFRHDAHAGSGASATNSLSPIATGTRAVMAKSYRGKKEFVCTVPDST
jgi:hypothetical protein